jgi:hypothetical protein
MQANGQADMRACMQARVFVEAAGREAQGLGGARLEPHIDRQQDTGRALAEPGAQGYGAQGLGLRVQGFGLRVLGLRVLGSGFWAQGLGLRVQGFGLRVLGLRVLGSGFWAQGVGAQGLGAQENRTEPAQNRPPKPHTSLSLHDKGKAGWAYQSRHLNTGAVTQWQQSVPTPPSQ